jgi:hypothetical protein
MYIDSEYSDQNKGSSSKNGNLYEQYVKILEGMIMHKCLIELAEVPLFMKIPTSDTKNNKQINLEFANTGHLNFNTILQRLKTKKYGPGRNMIKVDQLNNDIRKIFSVCEKYYSYHPISIRVSRTLESFFENKLAKMKQKGGIL